ncbi:MAG: hypothetical protein M1820_000128 [Bogoriella megaspora]|nr:MAG: hypothetical protein M1820_000128 [Bogoriella megaspora]
MVLAKSKNAVGLGNSLMNDRFGKGKRSEMHRGTHQAGIQRQGADGSTYVTNNKKDAAWVKMQSRTEQSDLDEFLSTAELAGTDFTAEKLNNIKIIHSDQKNPYLLSAAEERATVKKQQANRKRLTVPRRPPWDEHTTARELDERERESLLEWRRGLADLQENHDLLMTPFERNLEVWRQLWRVIERSDLVVQIVDARSPLLFRCEDLEKYVKEVDKRKRNLLLVNKADMMTEEQRKAWSDYFREKGIRYKFFSASLAKELNEARGLGEDLSGESEMDGDAQDDVVREDEVDEIIEAEKEHDVLEKEAQKLDLQEEQENEEEWVSEEEVDTRPDEPGLPLSDEDPTRILTTDELEELFLQHAPKILNDDPDVPPRKTQIGLVGYPNVGKSSTINALIGAKKVSVSATPGKTKHFQTIHLSPRVVLCDCPGLVFPNFATTKAELVVNGILPIDQLREYTGPAALVAQRIPKAFLETVYGMKIETRPLEEGGTGTPTAEELLSAYAKARGFATTGQGQPDESRAARYVLKDYVKGKLLFCHPPPSDSPINDNWFNRELYDERHLPQKRRAALAIQEEAESSMLEEKDASLMDSGDMVPLPPVQGSKSINLDQKFFAPGQGNSGHMKVPASFGYKGSEELSGRKQKAMIALERDVDPSEVRLGSGKKHFKGNKRKAKRAGYE